jgi:site-specific DNA-adenine methylase
MKALELLKTDRDYYKAISNDNSIINQYEEAIKELEYMKNENKELKEYYRVARRHLEFYRCKCGSLGRVGYLCSNKDCENER